MGLVDHDICTLPGADAICPTRRAAQPARAADAALRPRDRSDFEGWNLPTVFPIYVCGAANAHSVGPQINAKTIAAEDLMRRSWLYILLPFILCACGRTEGVGQAYPPPASPRVGQAYPAPVLPSVSPAQTLEAAASTPTFTVQSSAVPFLPPTPTPEVTALAATPSLQSQSLPSELYDRIPHELTSFHEPRQTPQCQHPMPPPLDMTTPQLSLKRLKNAAYLVNSGSFTRIQLVDGKYIDPALKGLWKTFGAYDRARLGTKLLEPVIYGDVDANGTEDAIVLLDTWGGGTGFWRDVVIVLNDDGNPISVAAIYFGDRDVINSVAVQQGDVLIDATARGEAVGERKQFRLCAGTLVLVRETPN
jgi:hypothetical protein